MFEEGRRLERSGGLGTSLLLPSLTFTSKFGRTTFHRIQTIGFDMITRHLMKSSLMLVLLWVALPGYPKVGEAIASEERAAPMEMGGVAIGMKRKEVLSLLGKPARQRVFENFIVLEVVYPDLAIGFDESDAVSELEARTSKVCLLKRICRGMALSEMQSELRRHGYIFNVIGDVLYVNGDGCWGEARLSGGKAQSVRVLCSP
jgi:hypothetical protein